MKSRSWRSRAVVVGLLAAGWTAWAQSPAAAPAPASAKVIEVQRGDTFSGIAARLAGKLKSWSEVYDPQMTGLPDANLILPGMRFELITDASGRRYVKQVGGPQVAAVAAAAAKPAKAAPPASPPVPAPAPAPAPPAVTAAAAPAAAAPTPPAEPQPLVIGVLPNISATTLMTQYEGLKTYLERGGAQKVRIVVPANFKAFFDATLRGDYDVAVSAPHFARVAQADARMVPLAMFEPRIPAQFVAPIDPPLSDASAVRGKVVAFANPTSLVAMYGQQWLRQKSLEAGKDFEVRGARSDLGVGRMLLSGDAAAAIMSGGEFRALPPDESARLRIVEVFARIPNFIIIGHPRLGNERLARLKGSLLAFMADKDDGAAFAKAAGITGIVEVDDATLRELDPFMTPTRRLMGTAN